MIELRRYQLEDESTPVTEWLHGLRDARARVLARFGCGAYLRATSVTVNRLAKAFQNCVWILEPVTVCITENTDRRW